MDELESALLLKLQKHFPLTARPFESLGRELGLSEEEALTRTRRLKQDGLIRQISAIFDSRKLGYQSALVAAYAPDARLEAAAAKISAHPGVSHNYEREHAYNLWFTFALAPGRDFTSELKALAESAGLERWMLLPALRTFKIEVALDAASAGAQRSEPPQRQALDGAPVFLSEVDKEAVRRLQEDMPLVTRPFLGPATAMGMNEEQLFDWMAGAGSAGYLRRFAAILRHRKAGFSANGMGVWNLPPERVEEAGRILASFRAVSHCYERPVGPNWPYRLYSMVHARSREEAGEIFAELSKATGLDDYRVLFSTREFKKERVKYFLEDREAPLWRPLAEA